ERRPCGSRFLEVTAAGTRIARMSTARSPQGFPLLVASLCGVVVAGVSATTGVAAHGMASTGPHSAVTGGGAFAAFLVCALVGVLTTAAAHRFPPALVVPSGLVG